MIQGFTNEQQKVKIQFITKFCFTHLSRVNPLPKQINKGSLVMSSVLFSSDIPPWVNLFPKQINKGSRKYTQHLQCCRSCLQVPVSWSSLCTQECLKVQLQAASEPAVLSFKCLGLGELSILHFNFTYFNRFSMTIKIAILFWQLSLWWSTGSCRKRLFKMYTFCKIIKIHQGWHHFRISRYQWEADVIFLKAW